MKKALSILLTMALLLTSLWSVAGTAMAATASEDYFETAENWKTLYGDDVVGVSTTNRVTVNKVTTDTYENGAAAICFSGTMHNRTAAIALPVEQGKTYKLSFMYKGDFNGTATAYSIKKSGVYKKGATIVSQEGPSGTALAEGTTASVTDNTVYNAYELTFTVGENADVYFVAHFWTASWVWIDEFKLEDLTPTYYENPENWHTHYGDDVVGESTTNRVTIDQAKTETYNNGAAAIRFSGTMHNRSAAVALPVEAGRTYKLSFMYKADFNGSATSYSIKKSGVYEKGATIVSQEGPSGTALAEGTTTSITDKTVYNSYELTFTVGENADVYFVAHFWSASWVWIDEFELVDITPTYYEIAENWHTHYGDDVVGVSTTNRITIERTTTDTYNNGAAAIRFSGTMHNRSAAVALPVEAGRTYKLSFMYKADFNGSATAYSIKKSGVYEKGATIVSQEGPSGTALAEGTTVSITDKTVYNSYELTFTVGENSDVYFVAHFWSASWVWIDDFELEDITPPYYELAENWHTHYGDDVIGESTENRIPVDRATTDTNNDGEVAIRFSGTMHNRTAAIALPVEQGKTYKLSFMYKGDFNGSATSYSIKKSGVFEKGATIVSQQGPSGTAVVIKGSTAAVTDNTVYNPYEITFTVYDNTDLYFAAHFWNASWVWIDDFELEEIASEPVFKTSYNSMAAIRAAGTTDGNIVKNGLRVYNAVKTEWTNNSNIVEYGSFVVRKGYMEEKFGSTNGVNLDTVAIDGTERTLVDLIGSGVGLGVAFRAEGAETLTSELEGYEGAKEILWESDATQKVFTSYITGISAANYGEEYLVRTYAIDNKGNVYYGNTSSICIFDVAQAISAANLNNEIDNAAFEAFVGNQTDVYEQWCEENGLEAGGLFESLYLN